MYWFRNAFLFFLVVSFATVGLAGKRQDDSSNADAGKKEDTTAEDKSKGKDQDKDADDNDADAGHGKMALPLVAGHPSFNVKIPYRDAQGKLQAMYTIGQVDRVDEDDAKLSNMKVETFDEKGDPDMSMDFPTSVLNLSTHVLVSHTPVTISRHDFTISGDSVEFNMDTKEGTLVGHVHMSVYDLNAAANPASDDAESQPQETKENAKK